MHSHADQTRNGHAPGFAQGSTNPVLVEVTRGALVESRHRGAVAVMGLDGATILSAGDLAAPVYPRSAIKPIQALALLETGAADAYGLGPAEIALACASHGGEPRHVETVERWLARIGCTQADLECGSHLPSHEPSAAALLRAGGVPAPVHNNCSGKHAGFLTVARHLGVDTRDYIALDHPVQQTVLGILEQMTALDLGEAPRGTDGCGIPVIGVPLGNLALAMARLSRPSDQPKRRRDAAVRVRAAMAAEPFMVAGSGRFCTRVMALTGERALVKTGAEGVFCAALPDRKLGIALKIDDGAGRAAGIVMGSLLRRFGALDDAAAEELGDLLCAPVLNRAGAEVGQIRAVDL